MTGGNAKKWMFLAGGTAAVVLAAVLSVLYGSTQIPLSEILRAL